MTVKGAVRRAAYRALWRSGPAWRLANARAAWGFRRSTPTLGPAAARCVTELRRDGVTVTSLTALTGSDDLLRRLQDYSAELESLQQPALARQQELVRQGHGVVNREKAFVTQLLGPTRPVIEPSGLLAELALHPQVQGIADSYFGLLTRVSDINIWRSQPSGAAPVSSQLWHRDVTEDRIVLKAFLYLEPVVEGAGPFRYATGTQPGGPGPVSVTSEYDGLNHRVQDGPAAEQLLAREKVFLGSAGTLVIADTLGYHRGGWATTDPRLVLQVRFGSRTAVRNTRLGTPVGLRRSTAKAWRRRLAYDWGVVGAPLLPQQDRGRAALPATTLPPDS